MIRLWRHHLFWLSLVRTIELRRRNRWRLRRCAGHLHRFDDITIRDHLYRQREKQTVDLSVASATFEQLADQGKIAESRRLRNRFLVRINCEPTKYCSLVRT